MVILVWFQFEIKGEGDFCNVRKFIGFQLCSVWILESYYLEI